MTKTFLIFGAFLVLIVANSFGEPNVPCPACMRSLPVDRFTDKSIYQAESSWTTDQQKQIKLGDLRGKPQVVLMFFSRCTTACPVLINDLKRISAALTPEERAQVGFTLVSFDAQQDTPSALAEYRGKWNLSDEHWTFLSGRPDDIRELAMLLGIQFKETADGFAHSNVITLLNARGEIVHQQVGLNSDIVETVRQIQQMTK
jgi:protein SCO1